MTASPNTRTPLQRLEAHSLWLTLASLNLTYVPVMSLLLQPRRDPADNYLTNAFILMGAAAVWLISLLILIAVAQRHGDLRDLARKVTGGPGTPAVTKGQRRRFGDYRDGAYASLFGSPLILGLLGTQNLGNAVIIAVLMFVVNLPAALIWLMAAKRDVELVRRAAAAGTLPS